MVKDEVRGDLSSGEKKLVLWVLTHICVDEGCPICYSTNIFRDTARGEIVCGGCGTVLSERYIDERPEWGNWFEGRERDTRRTGAPPSYSMPDKGLSTVIDRRDTDGHGGRLSAERRRQMSRLRRVHTHLIAHTTNERNLAYADTELLRLVSVLHVSPVRNDAGLLCRKALNAQLIKGRSKQAAVAACVYLACRERGIPLPLKRVVEESGAASRPIKRFIRTIIEEFGVNAARAPGQGAWSETTTDHMQLNAEKRFKHVGAEKFIPACVQGVKLSAHVERRAVELLNWARKMGLTVGRMPEVMVASVIYIAALEMGECRTQGEIARVAGVTQVSIRNRYKEIVQKLGIAVNSRKRRVTGGAAECAPRRDGGPNKVVAGALT